MGSKDDKRSKSAAASGAGLFPVQASVASEPEALSRELRELHERYGDAGEIPEHLIALARQVAEAYARMAQDGEADGIVRPSGDRSD